MFDNRFAQLGSALYTWLQIDKKLITSSHNAGLGSVQQLISLCSKQRGFTKATPKDRHVKVY